MKTLITLFILITSVSFKTQEQKSLLIGKWKQFAWKAHDSKELKKTDEECANKKITFEKNGSYKEEMYCLKSTGQWYFNSDQTKIGFTLETFNGMKSPPSNSQKKYTNTIILKLTKDTLIYGHEGYFGNDRIYGHNDWYFVRQK
jgi:hypothetical protein